MTSTTTTSTRQWSPNNPFAQRIADRLAARGGQHRPPGTDSDSRIARDEFACSLARETQQLHAAPLPPSPF